MNLNLTKSPDLVIVSRVPDQRHKIYPVARLARQDRRLTAAHFLCTALEPISKPSCTHLGDLLYSTPEVYRVSQMGAWSPFEH